MMQSPKILYENILNVTTATLTATTWASGYDYQNVLDWRTHTLWKGSSATALEFTLDLGAGGDRAANCIGICAHNLNTANYKITVQDSTNGTTWTDRLAATQATSDDVLMSTFSESTNRYWKVALTSSAITTAVPYIAVMALGTALEFPRPPLIGASPVNESIVAKSNRSQTGILLGNVIKYHPMSLNLNFNYLPSTFFRSTSGAPANYGTFWKNHGRYLLPFFVNFSADTYQEARYFMRLADNTDFTMPLQDSTGLVQSLTLNLVSCQESST
jgi:hypothetical protein